MTNATQKTRSSPTRKKPSKPRKRALPADPFDRFDYYLAGVESGELPAGKLIRLAVERHRRDLARRRSPFYWDEDAARHAIEFFPMFLVHHVDRWAGQPFLLEPWQAFIVGSLFGWRRKADGGRRWREAYIEVPRKNGKSTVLAGLCAYLLTAAALPGAYVVTAATKKDQARIIFDTAKRMIQASAPLRAVCDCSKLLVEVAQTGSKMEPLSSDHNSLDGLNPSAAMIDELHAHRKREVYDKLDTATGARADALIASITTAGDDTDSICRIVHDQSESVLHRMAKNDKLFAFIATMDPEDDWRKPATWAKANPNLGVSVHEADLRAKCDKAKANPANVGPFLRYHLNVWRSGGDRMLDPDRWLACEWTEGKHFSYDDLSAYDAAGGLDLAAAEDLAAFVIAFSIEKRILLLPFFFAPEVGIEEKEQTHRLPYRDLADDGYIELMAGEELDCDEIGQRVVELCDRFACGSVAFDPWNAVPTAKRLEREYGLDMVRFPQTSAHYNTPTRRFGSDVIAKRIRHPGHPILTAHAGNLTVAEDSNGNRRPVKPKKRSARKIDGMVAALMAYDTLVSSETTDSGSIIEVVGD